MSALGFVGSTCVLTSWGACRLHDLARLTTGRALAVASWQAKAAALHATWDEAIAQAADEQKAALTQEAEAQQQLLQEQCDADLAARLPRLQLMDGLLAELTGVVEDPTPITSVVDVTIAQLGDQENPIIIKVRCTPDCMFVTEQGNVAASDLERHTVVRKFHDDTTDVYEITSVVPVELTKPAPVYRVLSPSEVCCIGADSYVTVNVIC